MASSTAVRRGVRGFLVAPLVVQGAVFGAVELSDMARERAFSRDEIDLVEAVCRVAGLAMDNALLIDDLEGRNREAELLNEIAARTSAIRPIFSRKVSRSADMFYDSCSDSAVGPNSDVPEYNPGFPGT